MVKNLKVIVCMYSCWLVEIDANNTERSVLVRLSVSQFVVFARLILKSSFGGVLELRTWTGVRLWRCIRTTCTVVRLWRCIRTTCTVVRFWRCIRTTCTVVWLWRCVRTTCTVVRFWRCIRSNYVDGSQVLAVY